MIKFENIRFGYGSIPPLLNNFTFEIKDGECLGLIGPSGGGKTTIAKILAGHLKPEGGSVTVDGQNLTGQPSRQIILINQESDLFPWQTVIGHLKFSQHTRNDGQIREILNLVKLFNVENFYPHQLSGGMKKRLSLARALIIGPRLLILDEAFSFLDNDLKKGLFQDLQIIRQRKKISILIISHSTEDIKKLAQRKIYLANKPVQIIKEK